MDKFGIFKLLTSAFDFYQKNASKFNKINEQNNSPFTAKKEQAKVDNSGMTTKNIPLKPLQEGMLSTMRSHDEFMNRVYKNNKK